MTNAVRHPPATLPPAQPAPLDPGVLAIIEALARAQARKDYAAAQRRHGSEPT